MTDPNGIEKSSVSYKLAKKNISYGWNGFEWRFSKILTPNKKNIFEKKLMISKLKFDKEIYKNVKSKFSVKSNFSEDDLKYRWDFGDGKKSYKRKTIHKYKRNGLYKCSIKISNDVEEIIKTFRVNVENYPNYNVNIIEISANPKGRDSGNEYIIIKNKSKKTIKFDDWSIATGKDKKHLVNHPIRKDFKLKSGKIKKIYTKYSAISLPNKGGVVELRAPDGEAVYKKEYNYNENLSIPSGGVYKKTERGWIWEIPQIITNSEKQRELSEFISKDIVLSALANDNEKDRIKLLMKNKETSDNVYLNEDRSFFNKVFNYMNSLLGKFYTLNFFQREESQKKYHIIDIKINYEKDYLPNYTVNFLK